MEEKEIRERQQILPTVSHAKTRAGPLLGLGRYLHTLSLPSLVSWSIHLWLFLRRSVMQLNSPLQPHPPHSLDLSIQPRAKAEHSICSIPEGANENTCKSPYKLHKRESFCKHRKYSRHLMALKKNKLEKSSTEIWIWCVCLGHCIRQVLVKSFISQSYIIIIISDSNLIM